MRQILCNILVICTIILLVAIPRAVAEATISSTEKVELLENKRVSTPHEPIQLDTELYNKVTSKPRNYSIVTVLTALSPEHGCQPCLDFDAELRVLASSWAKQYEKGRLYLTVLDFKNGRDIFMKLGLNNVPYVLHFPPSEGQHANEDVDHDVYDVMKRGVSAESMAEFIRVHTQINIKVRRPPNYANYALGAVGFLFIALMVQWQWDALVGLYQDFRIWQTLCLGVVIFMCSGFMWNQIRGAPFSGMQSGRVELFAPGFGSQYVMETQVLAMMYGVTAATAVALVVLVPTIKDAATQRVVGYVCLAGFVILYSLLLRVFSIKNPGYPFRMLL